MFLIRFSEGLGNQLFQYMLYIILKQEYPEQIIKLDISSYEFLNQHNGFELERFFDIDIPLADEKELQHFFPISRMLIRMKFNKMKKKWTQPYQFSNLDKKFAKFVYHFSYNRIYDYQPNIFNKDIFCLDFYNNLDWCFTGHWQNVNYFHGKEAFIRTKLKFSVKLSEADQKLLSEIEKSYSVGIHIREGDFINNRNHQLCNVTYYERAILLLESLVPKNENKLQYFIFTDSEDYHGKVCEGKNRRIISHKKDCGIDMFLMSKCKHNIIANSTFSFWGAFLNENKDQIVIAPKYAYRYNNMVLEFSVPITWNVINNI